MTRSVEEPPLAEQALRGKIIVVSGPSGAGKSTLLRAVRRRCPDQVQFSVSATTRAPRPGERDGVDYHFLSHEDFQARRAAGEFLECCEVFGRGDWYGTLLSEVTPALEAGRSVLLEIDVDGAAQVLANHADAVTIFIRPDSVADLRERLAKRGTETPAAARRRIEVAERELSHGDRFEYQVINHDLEQAVERFCEILQTIGSQA